jgi:hypothetical protein
VEDLLVGRLGRKYFGDLLTLQFGRRPFVIMAEDSIDEVRAGFVSFNDVRQPVTVLPLLEHILA